MYLDVTVQVNNRIGQGFFADPAFMTELDVTFANLYFAAADTAGTPAAVPRSSGRWGTQDTDDLPVRSAAARGVVPSQIVRARAVSTSSVVASSAILGKMARRLLRWAPSSGSVTASVTIVSS
jgi:hypothetical protein